MTAAYLFVPGLRQGWLFNVIAISSPIAIVIAVRLWKPQTRLPWYLFALGQAFFVAGDVITYNYDSASSERIFRSRRSATCSTCRSIPV